MRRKVSGMNIAVFAAVSCLGLTAGSLSAPAASQTKPSKPAKPAAQHGAVPFYLSLQPIVAELDGDRESLELAARVGNRSQKPLRAIVSATIETDRGAILEEARISPVVKIEKSTEAHALDMNTKKLADGFYRVRAYAVFAEGAGSETDSIYLRVANGKIELMEMSDWFDKSRANEALPREVGKR